MSKKEKVALKLVSGDIHSLETENAKILLDNLYRTTGPWYRHNDEIIYIANIAYAYIPKPARVSSRSI